MANYRDCLKCVLSIQTFPSDKPHFYLSSPKFVGVVLACLH